MTAALSKEQVTDKISGRLLPSRKKFSIPIEMGYDKTTQEWVLETLLSSGTEISEDTEPTDGFGHDEDTEAIESVEDLPA